jgi:ATP-dependent Lon protease
MTGEITLRGHVLPIGGLKEKILAARRAGIDTVVCPKLNQKELDEVPALLRRGMTFHLVEDVGEVLTLALVPLPKKKAKARSKPPASGKPSPKAYRPRPRRQVNV